MICFRFVLALSSCLCAAAQAATLTTLVDFSGTATPNKGATPRGALVLDEGLLWGSTESGGGTSNHGTLFKLDPGTATFTGLVEFAGITTGSKPFAGLLLASDGNFYGTTAQGGTDGKGTIFQMLPNGTLNTIYTFRTATESSIGSTPNDKLVEGADGFLYGTTSVGGLGNKGVIFKVAKTPGSTPVTLVEFTGGTTGAKRGARPLGLVLAKDGHFYGVTENEGLFSSGTLFKMTAGGVITTLGDFGSSVSTSTAPKTPRAPLVQGKDGNLYGTTALGGKNGFGGIYKTAPGSASATLLVSFTGTSGTAKGSLCETPLVQGTDGNFYGVTRKGGVNDRGTIFKMSSAGIFTTLIEFTGNGASNQGSDPRAALVQDNDGNFFGTTSASGANGVGTLYKLSDVLPAKAVVSTDAPTNIKGTSATLNGTVNTQGTAGTFWFEYGTTTNYGSRVPLTSGTLLASSAAVVKSTTVTGLLPDTDYHYRIVVTNGGGTTEGGDFSFRTGPHPKILDQPDDVLAGIGEAASFTVQSSGTLSGTPVTYAWLKNSTGTALGTQATYTIPKVALTNGGSYAVRVTKAPDSVLSSAARLGVISTANASVKPNEGATITLNVPNASPAGALSFQWKKDTVNVTDGGRFSGATTAKLVIASATDADDGDYTCEVTMGALPPKTSGTFSVTVLMRPVISPPTLGPWTTNGFLDVSQGIAAPGATSFFAANLPEGVAINKTTGKLTGRPINDGTYNIIFTAKNAAGTSAPLSVPVTVFAPEPETVGSFHGLIEREPSNEELGGSVMLTISSTGAVTGKIIHAGRGYSFVSKLSDLPNATRTITPTTITGTPAITATFTLTEATGVITGTVSGANVLAKRMVPALLATQGRYNLGFSPTAADSTNPALPQGSGFGTLTIGATGTATWVGRLGDNNANGVVLTVVSGLATDGTVPLHQSLYAIGSGSAQGWLTISGAHIITEQSFDWLKLSKPGNSTSRSYKTGFALHNLEADGAKYVKPLTNQRVLGLSTDAAELEFTMGGLPATITQALSLPATNVPTLSSPNPNTVTLKLDLTLGTFSGSFIVPDALPANVRKVTFLGVLLPHANQGIGQFQLPELPNPTTSALLSGRVVLGAP
jgi:uncharacterized repeat protein (TIGR03803 family)